MRHSLISKTLSAAALIALIGCGGGNNTTVQAKYEGAATVGDYAHISVQYPSGNNPATATLDYNVSGYHFNGSGSASLNRLFGSFWRSTTSPTFGMLLTDNLAVAKVPISGGYAYVVGLQTETPPDPNLIAGKHYLSIEINNDNTTNGWDILFNTDGTFSASRLGGGGASGCWKVLGNHLVAKAGLSDCSAIDDTSADLRYVIKTGTTRNSIIVDKVDGTGFGIGLEQKTLVPGDLSGTFYSYYQTPSADGFDKVVVNGNGFSWYNCPNGACQTNAYITGTIAINQLCDGTPYDGVACATDSNGDTYHLLIDADDHYYFAVGFSRDYLEVGSN